MTPEGQEISIKRLGAFAGMVDDYSALVITAEQFNRCACECMARMVSVHDDPDQSADKALAAVQAAEALAKALSKAQRSVGPMAVQKRIGGK